jgi:hypothetical protein
MSLTEIKRKYGERTEPILYVLRTGLHKTVKSFQVGLLVSAERHKSLQHATLKHEN